MLVEIISFISWPILIYISYRLVLVALRYFHKNLEKSNNQSHQ